MDYPLGVLGYPVWASRKVRPVVTARETEEEQVQVYL